jgi:hypothetical protein
VWVLIGYVTPLGDWKDVWTVCVRGTLLECVASTMKWLQARGCHSIEWDKVDKRVALISIIPPIVADYTHVWN